MTQHGLILLVIVGFVCINAQYVIMQDFQPNTNCNPNAAILNIINPTGCVNTAAERWDYQECTSDGRLIRNEICNSDCSVCQYNNTAFSLNTCYESVIFQCSQSFPKIASTSPVLAYYNNSNDCPNFSEAQQWSVFLNTCTSYDTFSMAITCVNGAPTATEYTQANCTGTPEFSGPLPKCTPNVNQGYFCGAQ
eukprot:Phypoly_transcript_22019.p1 GENE.Phypoly_transcript_22019~~Phypoly_transcript_22019.p1  ORF type:complete len:204 (+),score=24.59 Phypoly_transcript_22019:34-612(+)